MRAEFKERFKGKVSSINKKGNIGCTNPETAQIKQVPAKKPPLPKNVNPQSASIKKSFYYYRR